MSDQAPKPASESGITANQPVPASPPPSRPDIADIEPEIPDLKKSDADDEERADERAQHLGCGLGLVIFGSGLLAQKLGWIPAGDWLWPAILIGLGGYYLYRAFRK